MLIMPWVHKGGWGWGTWCPRSHVPGPPKYNIQMGLARDTIMYPLYVTQGFSNYIFVVLMCYMTFILI